MERPLDVMMPFKALKEQAVWASDIGNYWYCACKILHSQTYGEEETPEMNEGRARHQAESEADVQELLDSGLRSRRVEIETIKDVIENNVRNLNIILSRGLYLADNRDHRAYYGVINCDPPIVGVPDSIGLADKGWVVIYEKKRKLAPDGTPYLGQRMQLAVYLMTLEQIGVKKCFGLVYTRSRSLDAPTTGRVYLTEEDRSRVLSAAQSIRGIRDLKMAPIPTANPRKCDKCQYLKVCTFSPLTQLATNFAI